MNIFGSLSKLAAIASAVASLFPVAIQAVQGAEAALGPGTGAAKLALVQATLQTVYATEQAAVATWAEVSPAITSIVNTIVAAINAVKKGTTTATS